MLIFCNVFKYSRSSSRNFLSLSASLLRAETWESRPSLEAPSPDVLELFKFLMPTLLPLCPVICWWRSIQATGWSSYFLLNKELNEYWSIQLSVYLSTWIPEYPCAHVPMYSGAYLPRCLCPHVPMCLCTQLPMNPGAHVPMCPCTFVPMYPCTW